MKVVKSVAFNFTTQEEKHSAPVMEFFSQNKGKYHF